MLSGRRCLWVHDQSPGHHVIYPSARDAVENEHVRFFLTDTVAQVCPGDLPLLHTPSAIPANPVLHLITVCIIIHRGPVVAEYLPSYAQEEQQEHLHSPRGVYRISAVTAGATQVRARGWRPLPHLNNQYIHCRSRRVFHTMPQQVH